MNLEDLRALLAVVKYGSFQATAAALKQPRTRLRRQLDRLEATVGVQLLHRETRGVKLTSAGQQVVRRAGPLLSQATALVADAQAGEGASLGTLALIVPVGMPSTYRAQALLFLQELHPGLVLDVVEADDPLTLLRSPFEFMLHFGPAPEMKGCFSRVLMRLPLSLMASPAYLEQAGTPARVEELRHHRLLAWRAERRFVDSWPLLGGGSFAIRPSVISANVELLMKTVELGGGIALLPWAAPFFSSMPEGLVPVLEGVVGGELVFRTLSRQTSRTDKRLRAIVDNLQRLLDMLPPGASPPEDPQGA